MVSHRGWQHSVFPLSTDHFITSSDVASWLYLRFANHHCLIEPRCHLNTYGRWSGTRCLTSSEIRRVVLTVLSSFLRQSWPVYKRFLNVMHYINPCFTYSLSHSLIVCYLVSCCSLPHSLDPWTEPSTPPALLSSQSLSVLCILVFEYILRAAQL